MKSNKKFFKNTKTIPIDQFFNNVLFDKKIGYYSSKTPFGTSGDFITAPGISNLFCEMVGVWLISTWNTFGKPKKFNIVELGPGDGNLTKVLLKVFHRFPEFEKSINIFLYEKSTFLKNLQKKNLSGSKIKWIKNFSSINKGPVVFLGNEFFDAIPIKQFLRKESFLFEKYFSLNENNQISEVYKKISSKVFSRIKKFKSLQKLEFIEFPQLGLDELEKMTKKISKLNGGILLIDYGYFKPNNNNTLQSVMRHKKNNLFSNLGHADITSLVNFSLLNEYFIKSNLKVKKIVTQKFFLEKLGILERANNLSKKMTFKEKSNLYLRLKRLLDHNLMGKLFKVIFAYNFKKNNFLGFE